MGQPIRSAPRDATDTEAAPHIARIDRLTDAGRVNWFGLMAYLVFVFITLLGVEDADFFIPARQTQLPLIGVAIPTEAFFYFAPALGAALYVYLHLYVRKATGALTAAPARVDGTPLERHLKPWLLNDMVLRARGDGAIEPRPLDSLATLTVVALVWVAGPFVLFGMWVRTWPAHNEALTTIAGLCLMLAIHAGHVSWVRLRRDLAGEAARTTFADIPRDLAVLLVAMLVLNLGWVKTEGGRPSAPDLTQGATLTGNVTAFLASLPNLADPDWWGALAPARLAGVQFSALPPDQADPVAARQRYRAEWCARTALMPEICGALPDPGAEPDAVLWSRRASWCQANGVEDCPDWFAARDADFRSEWSAYRRAVIAALPKPDLSRADLRGADLSGTVMTGVTLTGARLDRANLRGAQLERATLTCTTAAAEFDQIDGRGESFEDCVMAAASLHGADLADARLVGAKLAFVDLSMAIARDADLTGADLRHARLRRSDVSGARMVSADFRYADLDGAYLNGARLHHSDMTGARARRASLVGIRFKKADLSFVELSDANLRTARLPGADMSSAKLGGAELTGAYLPQADLRSVDLEGANLTGARLGGADMRRVRLAGADLSRADLSRADLQEAELRGTLLVAANLQGASLRGAAVAGSPAHGADLRGATVEATALAGLVGNVRTLLPERLPDGTVPHVCSCWAEDPPGAAIMAARYVESGGLMADLRDTARGPYCAPDSAPRRTGTPWPADAPPPWGARREGEDVFDYQDRRVEWAASQPERGPCPPVPGRDSAR